MTVVPPQPWRVVGDRLADDEWFIPMTPRHLEVFRKLQAGPTEEERTESQQRAERREMERRSKLAALEARHSELRATFVEGVVADLLHEHRPRSVEHDGQTWLDCYGCPSYDDTGVEIHHSWPCPTWQTISDATP